MQTTKDFSAKRGVTLIEVSIGIIILGLLMAGILAGYRTYLQTRASEKTAANMEAVEQALGAYQARTGMLPAPMPFNLGVGTTDLEAEELYGNSASAFSGTCSGTSPYVCEKDGENGNKVLIGLLPFKALNLAAEQVIDGYGRMLTYAVSKPMTEADADPDDDDAPRRSICVKDQIAEIDPLTGNQTGVISIAGGCSSVEDVVILSHGRDGHGAYTAQMRPYIACDSGKAQSENCNNDGTFVRPLVKSTLASNNLYNDDTLSVEVAPEPGHWNKDGNDINPGDADQYVGIGVDVPSRNLDVGGNISAAQLRAQELCVRDGTNDTDCMLADAIAGEHEEMKCYEGGFVTAIHGNATDCVRIANVNCPPGEAMVSMNGPGGTPVCQAPDGTTSPVNGVCGPADGQDFTSAPSASLCSTGTNTAIAGAGPWTWTCLGQGGGTDDNCSANLDSGPPAIDGECGDSDGDTLATAPTSDFCDVGTASTVSGTGPWTWTCSGQNGGADDACTASLDPGPVVNGFCGPAHGVDVSIAPTTDLCSNGSATAVAGSGPWTWDCQGSNGGSDANCSANVLPVVNGACGTANGTFVATAPTTDLCSTGTASAVGGTGPWNWTCDGSGGGTTASCSANPLPVINGACSSTAGACTAGTVSGDNGASACGTTRTWTCNGSGGGTTANCSKANPACAPPVHGSCGTANKTFVTTSPTGAAACASGTRTSASGGYSNPSCGSQNGGTSGYSPVGGATGTGLLCSQGGIGPASGTGPWSWQCRSLGGSYTWTCAGANGGSSASCKAYHDPSIWVAPVTCTASAYSKCRKYSSTYSSQPATNTATGCLSGTYSERSDISNYVFLWNCDSDICGAINSSVPGMCGSSHGITTASAPSSNLCVRGTPSAVTSTSTKYNWTCAGGAGNAVCSANKP